MCTAVSKMDQSTTTVMTLHHHLQAQNWTAARTIFQTPQQEQLSRMVASRDEFENTPLHIAIGYQAPEDLVIRILCAYPQACQVAATEDMWLPLHVAAMWGCSTRVLEALIRAYPEGLDQQEGKGRTPRFFSTRFPHNRDFLEQSTEDWKRIISSNHRKWEEILPSSSLISSSQGVTSIPTANKRQRVCCEAENVNFNIR